MFKRFGGGSPREKHNLSSPEAPTTRFGERSPITGTACLPWGPAVQPLSLGWKAAQEPVGICGCPAGPCDEGVKLSSSRMVSPADITLPMAGGAPGSAALTLTAGSWLTEAEALNVGRAVLESSVGFTAAVIGITIT